MKDNKFYIIVAIIFGLFSGLKMITFFQEILISLLVYGFVEILTELITIKRNLQDLRNWIIPQFYNCKHAIYPYIEKDEKR